MDKVTKAFPGKSNAGLRATADDLEDCWQDLRATSDASVEVTPDQVDLLDDWRDVRNIPKFFYSVVKGFGPDYMVVRRVRCMGLASRSPRLGGPAYRGIVDKVLYRGSKYKEHPKEDGRQYAYPIKNCDLTAEAAKARFYKYLQEHLTQQREHVQHWEASVADLQRDIDRAKQQMSFWSIFSLNLEEV